MFLWISECAVLSCSVVYDSWHDSLYGAWTLALQAPLYTGILQARILEWVDLPSSKGSSPPRNQTRVSRIAAIFFTS